MSEFSISSPYFEEGGEIPEQFGYKFENFPPAINHSNLPKGTKCTAIIMDDPDAMAAVGKVWVHWLEYCNFDYDLLQIPEKEWPTQWKVATRENIQDLKEGKNPRLNQGKTDFGEIGYGGPAPPDKRHTYVFKEYALDVTLDLKEGYSKQEFEEAMKGHIIAEAKLTGTYAP